VVPTQYGLSARTDNFTETLAATGARLVGSRGKGVGLHDEGSNTRKVICAHLRSRRWSRFDQITKVRG